MKKENFFNEIHPFACLVYMIVLLGYMLTADYGMPLIFIFAAVSINIIAIKGIKSYAKSLWFYVIIMLLGGIFNIIFNHRGNTPFLYVNDVPLTIDALIYGVYSGMLVSILFMWFIMFNQYFDNKKIVYLIGGRFPSTALIISMVFCFYDKFLYKIDKIKEVWRTFEKKGRLSKIRNAGIVLSVLLSAMLEDSVDTAKSMNARGYGTGKRTRYTPYTWKKIDFMIVLCAVAAVLLPIEIVAIIAIIPTIYNICKEIQWKFYLWRI